VPAPYKRGSERSKARIESLSKLAASRGGKLLSQEFISSKSKLLWECKFGHTWESSTTSVEQQSSWCPICSGNRAKSLDDLIELVKARGGSLLSTEYKNVDTKYEYQCSLGHKFSNSYAHVKNGQWCPTCSKGTKSEEMAREAFQQIFQVPFPKTRPSWLRNSRGRQMELDGYNENLGIAFEYQGIQHFSEGFFGQDLSKRIADDEKKLELCKEQNVILMYLTHEMHPSSFRDEILKQTKSYGLDVSAYDFESEIDFSATYIRRDRMQDLINLLEPKNIKVLSEKWLGTNDLYEFSCNECGYIWEARGSAFFNSRRIAGCDACARKEYGRKRLLGIEKLEDFAHSHGGKCLSREYVRRNYKYKWECSKSHQFERSFNNMKYRNQFCPRCEEN
jgi:hypothetical protein